LLRILPAILLVGLLPVSVMGQPKKIPKEPLQVVDADSGKLIPELLLLPRFFSFSGIHLARRGARQRYLSILFG